MSASVESGCSLLAWCVCVLVRLSWFAWLLSYNTTLHKHSSRPVKQQLGQLLFVERGSSSVALWTCWPMLPTLLIGVIAVCTAQTQSQFASRILVTSLLLVGAGERR